MKCPSCNSQGLIAFSIGGPYIVSENPIKFDSLPKELRFFCNNCKKRCDQTDVILKVLYNHIGKIDVDERTISRESDLPPKKWTL